MELSDPPRVWTLAVAFLGAGVLCTLIAPLIRHFAIRVGVLDAPGGRKVHRRPIPRLGGLAVYAAVLLTLLVLFLLGRPEIVDFTQSPRYVLGVGGAVGTLLILGALDDIRHVPARIKFGVEIGAAVLVVAAAGDIESVDFFFWRVGPELGLLIAAGAVFYLVTVTNALNMIDGLDGLAGGVGAISAAALGLIAWSYGNLSSAVTLAAVAGSLTAFLLYNGRPARVFLGDVGSLPTGFLLGLCALYGLQMDGVLYPLPIFLILGIPLTDLVLAVLRRSLQEVSVVRRLGSPGLFDMKVESTPRLFRPDEKHIHHRLTHLGLSPRGAVLTLYGITAALSLLGLVSAFWPGTGPYLLVLAVAGLWWGSSRWLFEELRIIERGVLLPVFNTRFALSRWTHAGWDALAVAGCYLGAVGLVESVAPGPTPGTSRAAVGALSAVAVTLVVFTATSVYWTRFRDMSTSTAFKLIRIVLLALALTAAVQYIGFGIERPVGFWLLYAFLLMTAVGGARASFRILHSAYRKGRHSGRLALVYGAGERGTEIVRRIVGDQRLDMVPVGFIDDDPGLLGSRRIDYPVYGSLDVLDEVLNETHAEYLILSTETIELSRLEQIRGICQSRSVHLLNGEFSTRILPEDT